MAARERQDHYPFAGQAAVICGGSKGIGKATAREILRLGGSVCLIARQQERLEQAAAELTPDRATADQWVDTIACDATDEKRLRALLEDTLERRGVPHFLINCVGYTHPGYVQELPPSVYRQQMEINYLGQLIPILILLPHFMAARRGHIANVSSVAGFTGMVGYTAYAPTKFALIGLSEALRNELKPHNIHITILLPPDTDTPGLADEVKLRPPETSFMAGTGGLLSADEVAQDLVNGLLKKRLYVLPGEAAWIYHLNRFAPGIVRRYLDRKYAQARQKK